LLHTELEWWRRADGQVIGTVILDSVDKDYSWVMLRRGRAGFAFEDLGVSLPSVQAAREALFRCAEGML
jgi:hypothetical protein